MYTEDHSQQNTTRHNIDDEEDEAKQDEELIVKFVRVLVIHLHQVGGENADDTTRHGTQKKESLSNQN